MRTNWGALFGVTLHKQRSLLILAHYFIGHETVQRKKDSTLWYPCWLVYSGLKKVAGKMSDFFHLKYNKVMEIGLRIEI